MKVQNMTGRTGRAVANQFIITNMESVNISGGRFSEVEVQYFQSYKTIIVRRIMNWTCKTQLDRDSWDYSVTTGKYRNQFLGETKAETQKKIDSGEYILTDLN